MNLTFTEEGWTHYIYWQRQDAKLLNKINALIKECQRHPFEGTGKPEPLKGDFQGYWSRRINREHRLVYAITDQGLLIVQCRYHY